VKLNTGKICAKDLCTRFEAKCQPHALATFSLGNKLSCTCRVEPITTISTLSVTERTAPEVQHATTYVSTTTTTIKTYSSMRVYPKVSGLSR